MSAHARDVMARTGSREFLALMRHCVTCGPCNADTSAACPEAARLRRVWSRTQREARP